MSSRTGRRLRVLFAAALAAALIVSQSSDPVSARFSRGHATHHLRQRLLGSHKHQVDNSIEGVEIVDEASGAELTAVNKTALFNPASNTKLATSLAVLEKLGPDYRFQTRVWIDGNIDGNGVVHGNLYVTGNYMLFGDDEARELIKLLRARGISTVDGDLVVSSDFSMNLGEQGLEGGKRLREVVAPRASPPRKRRHHAAPRARQSAGIRIIGQVRVGNPPADASTLVTHNSPPLKHILKRMNCPSDNDMAERFGELIGGPAGLTDFLIHSVGVAPGDAQFSSTSGLYVNRISPAAMMKVLQALRSELAKHNLTFADIMAVAGVDRSTLYGRFNASGQAGSVIGKTGTLPETDNGASALSGEIHTKLGVYLFVIFDMHGDVSSFRARQNRRVTDFEDTHGGPQPIAYKPILPGFSSEAFWQ